MMRQLGSAEWAVPVDTRLARVWYVYVFINWSHTLCYTLKGVRRI